MTTSTQIEPARYAFECTDASWRVLHFAGEDELDRLPSLSLVLASDNLSDPAALLDAPAALTMARAASHRVFRGEVTRIEILGSASGFQHLRVHVESRLARARSFHRSRIFDGRTVPEIVEKVVGELGELGFEARLAGTYPTRDYCVQYEETDLTFVQRILEDEGITLVLTDDGTREVVALADAPEHFASLETPDGAAIPVVPARGELHGREHISRLQVGLRSAAPQVIARDWDWHGAGVSEVAFPESTRRGEVHDSNAHRGASTWADRRARARHEALAQGEVLLRGGSNVVALRSGAVIEVDDRSGETRRIRILSVRHAADCPEADPVAARGRVGTTYANEFVAVLADAPQRPQRRTARPRIHGIHTAIVTGPRGEEIHTDSHGRIRVRMHWDRSGSPDEQSSCWLAVAQSFAGSGWGAVFIPRVGMEVLVAFVGGDPDRPLCIGTVYNGTNAPPYPLPDEKTRTTLRTQSSPGGDGYNELSFEDRAGAEQVYVHAQRDLVERVRHDQVSSVGHDRSASVGRHDSLTVGGDQQVSVEGNQTIAVEGGGKSGTKGTTAAIKGSFEVRVTEPGHVLIDAASSITLQCGASSITIDPTTIKVTAGAGTFAAFDVEAMVVAAGGATAVVSDAVALRSAAGSAVSLDGALRANSAVGSTLALDDTVTATSAGAAKLTLDQDAVLLGKSVTAEASMGSALVLNDEASLTGFTTATCTAGGAAGGELKLDGTGVGLQGAKIGLAAAALAEIAGKLVKIN